MRTWLAEIRKASEMSQQEVADKTGISQSYYAGIESGTRGKPLNAPVAMKIASVLHFDWTRFYEDDISSTDKLPLTIPFTGEYTAKRR